MAANDDVRAQLIDAARGIVRARGYVGMSVKGAAAAAGVAPEVAMRYYDDRDALFAAVMKLPFDPASAVPALVAPGLEGMGERLVTFTLATLGDPSVREELVAMIQAGASTGKAVESIVAFIENSVIDRLARTLGVPDARMRTALIASQLVGLGVMRFGVRLEPLASASEDEVVRMLAPGIQMLLDPRNPIVGYDYEGRNQQRPSETTAAQAAGAARDVAASGVRSGAEVAASAVKGTVHVTEAVVSGAKDVASGARDVATGARVVASAALKSVVTTPVGDSADPQEATDPAEQESPESPDPQGPSAT